MDSWRALRRRGGVCQTECAIDALLVWCSQRLRPGWSFPALELTEAGLSLKPCSIEFQPCLTRTQNCHIPRGEWTLRGVGRRLRNLSTENIPLCVFWTLHCRLLACPSWPDYVFRVCLGWATYQQRTCASRPLSQSSIFFCPILLHNLVLFHQIVRGL